MSKTLLIMRHAKSSWSDGKASDHERGLTSRGKREAELMGRELVRRDLAPDLILTSTAKRARSTAKRVATQPGIGATRADDDRLYESSPRQCLRVLAAKGSGDTVLLIGHNPTFEELVHSLTSRYVALPTATVAVIRLPISDWAQAGEDMRGRLEALIAPRDIAGASLPDGRDDSAESDADGDD
jgi:phosphohistidine phosphatase